MKSYVDLYKCSIMIKMAHGRSFWANGKKGVGNSFSKYPGLRGLTRTYSESDI